MLQVSEDNRDKKCDFQSHLLHALIATVEFGKRRNAA
jgi:hypothetical protein